MNARRFSVLICALGLAVLNLPSTTPRSAAQGLGEQMTVTEGMNTLNSGSTGSNVGNLALDRARNVSGGSTNPQVAPPNMNGGPGQMPRPGAGPAAPMTPPPLTAADLARFAQTSTGPKITVISGVRVFDAVTGELIDDAIRRKVPESEKDKFFDDGTHGDLQPNDEVYTNVDERQNRKDVIGAANQRVKERLIQSLQVANSYNPVKFYGYTLMSTDRQEPLPRHEAWQIVPDPQGGPGFTLAEQKVKQPITVPKYRDAQKDKDHIVKDNWSRNFLQEYRKKPDDLTSEFFSVYIPQPPVPPAVAPPLNWSPFSDPMTAQRLQANNATAGGGSSSGSGSYGGRYGDSNSSYGSNASMGGSMRGGGSNSGGGSSRGGR